MRDCKVFAVADGPTERARLIGIGNLAPAGQLGRLPRWNTGALDALAMERAGFTFAAEMRRRLARADQEANAPQPMKHALFGLIKR